MSRISAPPIRSSEPVLATEQTSETESVQKTDIGTPIEAEQVAKEPAATNDTSAQHESRLGGLARQAELQLQFPSAPELKKLPDLHPNLDPNVHLDEKIDLTKNLPEGMAINKGLDGLDWGPNKAKTGPAQFVDITYGGMMKPPTDVLAEVRNGATPSAPNASGAHKDTRGTMTTGDGAGKGSGFVGSGHGPNSPPPPGVELSSRAPNSGLVGLTYQEVKTFVVTAVEHAATELAKVKLLPPVVRELSTLLEGPELVEKVTGDSTNLPKGIKGITDGSLSSQRAEELEKDKNKTVNPDADSGEVQLSAEEIARKIAVRGGATDPVRGSGPALIEVDKPPVRYGDLVTDPGDTSEAIDGKSTPATVIPGGGYTDGANRKDLPVRPLPSGSGGSNDGDL